MARLELQDTAIAALRAQLTDIQQRQEAHSGRLHEIIQFLGRGPRDDDGRTDAGAGAGAGAADEDFFSDLQLD